MGSPAIAPSPASYPQSVAAQGFELVEEDALPTGALRSVLCFPLQDRQRNPKIKPPFLTLGLGDHKRLKRREIVRHVRHRRPEAARVLQLGPA